MLKVYGRANSINVRKVLWMLGELNLPYEREDWGRGFRPTADPVFRAINPVGVVPVIDDDDPGSASGAGFRLRESHSIVRYLAEKHGRADLYPKDLRERATVESWMDWAATELADGMRPVFHDLVVKNPAFAGRAEGAAKDWAQQMKVLEDHLAHNGPYVMGGTFTVGDIPVGLVVNRWFSIDFEKPELKAVAGYYDRLAERPPYRAHGRNGMP
ncbi:MAG TPA: glutathione S-transferase family protein [Hyphomicrobiaceae bacterium]|jgi:glutathione S-transferase|nr:glutathione S-transferase family protein [Hyphomicrobiaceae bacterium]